MASSKIARFHPSIELDVAAQIEPVGHVVEVGEDLGLAGVALAPLPLLLEFVGELVGVLHALDIAAGTRIAVPVPGTPDAAGCLHHPTLTGRCPGPGAACTGRRTPPPR